MPALAVLAVLLIAGATFAVRSALASSAADGGASASASTEPTTVEPTTSESATEPSATPSETATTAEPPAELADCQSEIAAGETLAEAAALSAEHWLIHTQAQVKFSTGEYTLEESQADWAATKALGPEDQERFSEAQQAYDGVHGGCDALAAAEAEPEFQSQVDDCVARGEALNAVAAWGAAVNGDWAEHLEFMTTRPGADEVDYIHEWEGQVAAAPENHEPYLDAVADLEAAPACPGA